MPPPRSIRLFTMLFWASLTISIAADVFFWERTVAAIQAGQVGEEELTSSTAQHLMIGLAVIYALLVLTWFLTAEKRSRIAKWLYTLFAGMSAFGVAASLEDYNISQLALYGVGSLLMIASASLLFTPEVRDWFAGKVQIDTSTFG